MWKYKKLGFTLIEMMITVGVMAVIAAGAMAAIGQGPKQAARDAKRKADLEQIVSALEIYRSDNSGYPSCSAGTSCLISSTIGFTTNYLPVSPSDTTSGRSYIYIPLNLVNGSYKEYRLCASLEKDHATLPVVAACTGYTLNCGANVNCNYSVKGP